MEQISDFCTKEDILPILLSNRILYVPDDNAYQNWILFGIDLGLQGERLVEIKEMAMAKGSVFLNRVVSELIEEWFRKKAMTGERASTTELIEALRENDLEVFADSIVAAFSSSMLLPQRASSVSSMDSSVISLAQQGLSFASSVTSSAAVSHEVFPTGLNGGSSQQMFQGHSNSGATSAGPSLNYNNDFFVGFGESSGDGSYRVHLEGDQDWREWRDYFIQPTPTLKQEEPAANQSQLSAFHRAVKENRREDVIQLIKEGGVNVNELTNDKHQSSALHIAAWTIQNRDDAIEMIKILVHAGAALDIMNPSNSPFTDGLLVTGGVHNLPKLTWKQFDQFVRCLIETGHKKYLETPYGRNHACVLHWAMKEAILGRPTIGFLHSAGVNLNCLSTSGDSLLHYAIQGNRSIETIHYLVLLGADRKLRNQFNHNFLHVAIKYSNVAAFKYFLNLAPNLAHEKAKDGFSPIDLLQKRADNDAAAAAMLELVGKSN